MADLQKEVPLCLVWYLQGIVHAALHNLQKSGCGPTDEASVAIGDALAQLAKQLQRLPLCIGLTYEAASHPMSLTY